MALSNFERMIKLADEVFNVKDDPGQININPDVIERLKKIHPSTLSEHDDGKGPVAWVLLIPTTIYLMNSFIENKVTEKELFELTPLDTDYEAIYLCSAMVMDEYRRQGITTKLSLDAIGKIREDNLIKFLFVWAFSKEGELAAETIAQLTSLPLLKRVV